jgi:hypothetical protein
MRAAMRSTSSDEAPGVTGEAHLALSIRPLALRGARYVAPLIIDDRSIAGSGLPASA